MDLALGYLHKIDTSKHTLRLLDLDPTTGEYACWYQSYAGSRAQDPTRRVTLCYATSKDGLTWTKPKLRLFDFNGDLDTNIVLVGNGGRSVNYGASVLFDPTDTKPGKRYKLAYWDFTENEGLQTPGLCVAFSPDGIHWKKHSKAPLLHEAMGPLNAFSNECHQAKKRRKGRVFANLRFQ